MDLLSLSHTAVYPVDAKGIRAIVANSKFGIQENRQRLTMDMVGFAQDTPHADDPDVDALIYLLRDAQSNAELVAPSRAVMLRLADNGYPYPYANRLTRALDAVTPAEHDHGDGDVCPLCPPQSVLDEMGERNRRNEAAKRAALLAEIAASPASFVHLVEGYDMSGPKETIVMRVCSTLELATAYCMQSRMSDGVVYEIVPNRIDGDENDGNVVLTHFHLQDGVVTQSEGRWYPPRSDED